MARRDYRADGEAAPPLEVRTRRRSGLSLARPLPRSRRGTSVRSRLDTRPRRRRPGLCPSPRFFFSLAAVARHPRTDIYLALALSRFRSHPTLDAPRSHHKPKPRKGRKGKLDAVSEDDCGENKEENPVAKSSLRERGLSVRDDGAAGKRKSPAEAIEEEAAEPKRARDAAAAKKGETKEITRDQLLEVNAMHQAAQARISVVASSSADDASASAAIDPSQLTVPKLKEQLQAAGLSTDGKKKDLVERLAAHLASASEAAAEPEQELFEEPMEEAAPAAEPEAIEEEPAAEEEAAAEEEMDAAALTAQLNKKKVPELKAELRLAGLDDTGNKPALVARLVEHMTNPAAAEEAAEPAQEEDVEMEAAEEEAAVDVSEPAPMEEAAEEEAVEEEAKEEAEESLRLSTSPSKEAAVEEEEAASSSLADTMGTDEAIPQGFDATVDSSIDLGPPPSQAPPIAPEASTEDEAPEAEKPSAAEQQQSEQQQAPGWGQKIGTSVMNFFKGSSSIVGEQPPERKSAEPGSEKKMPNAGHALVDEMQRKLAEKNRSARLAGGADVSSAPMPLQAGVQEAALETLNAAAAEAEAAAPLEGVHEEEEMEEAEEAAVDVSEPAPTATATGAAPATEERSAENDGSSTARSTASSSGAETTVASTKGSVAAAKFKLGIGGGASRVAPSSAAAETTSAAASAGLKSLPKVGGAGGAGTGNLTGKEMSNKAFEAKKRAEAAKARAEEQRQLEAKKREAKLKEKEERAAAAAAEAEKAKKDQQAKAAAEKEAAEKRKLEERKRQEEAAEAKRVQLAEEAAKAKAAEKEKAAAAAKAKAEEAKAAAEAKKAEKEKAKPAAASTASSSSSSSASSSLPPLPEGWREYKAPDGRPYYVKPDGKTTTWERPKPPPNYTPANAPTSHKSPAASRHVSIDTEKNEDSGDDDEEDEPQQGNGNFPSWTSASWLVPKLAEQVALDGDAIFGQAVHRQKEAVDLGDIFGRGNNGHRYHKRTSSAHWNQDRLTSPEEHAHKRRMGWM